MRLRSLGSRAKNFATVRAFIFTGRLRPHTQDCRMHTDYRHLFVKGSIIQQVGML